MHGLALAIDERVPLLAIVCSDDACDRGKLRLRVCVLGWHRTEDLQGTSHVYPLLQARDDAPRQILSHHHRHGLGDGLLWITRDHGSDGLRVSFGKGDTGCLQRGALLGRSGQISR